MAKIYVQRHDKSNSNEIIYVDPHDIDYYLVEGSDKYFPEKYRDFQPLCCRHELEKAIFPQNTCIGLIMPGKWDKFKKEYNTDVVYNGIRSILVEDRIPESTEYVENLDLHEMANKKPNFAEKRIQETKELFRDINQNGYNPKDEIKGRVGGHIGINIGRNGELISNNDSHHRLAICKLLNLDEIPVRVIVRHEEWETVRREVQDSSNSVSREYQEYKSHPDLRNLD